MFVQRIELLPAILVLVLPCVHLNQLEVSHLTVVRLHFPCHSSIRSSNLGIMTHPTNEINSIDMLAAI